MLVEYTSRTTLLWVSQPLCIKKSSRWLDRSNPDESDGKMFDHEVTSSKRRPVKTSKDLTEASTLSVPPPDQQSTVMKLKNDHCVNFPVQAIGKKKPEIILHNTFLYTVTFFFVRNLTVMSQWCKNGEFMVTRSDWFCKEIIWPKTKVSIL